VFDHERLFDYDGRMVSDGTTLGALGAGCEPAALEEMATHAA
jgi:hypothetical protein